jgi:hypothetical protein
MIRGSFLSGAAWDASQFQCYARCHQGPAVGFTVTLAVLARRWSHATTRLSKATCSSNDRVSRRGHASPSPVTSHLGLRPLPF